MKRRRTKRIDPVLTRPADDVRKGKKKKDDTPRQVRQKNQRRIIVESLERAQGANFFVIRVRAGSEYEVGANLLEVPCPYSPYGPSTVHPDYVVYFPERKVKKGPADKDGRRREYYESVAHSYMFIGTHIKKTMDDGTIDYGLSRLFSDRNFVEILGIGGRPAVMNVRSLAAMAKECEDPGFAKLTDPNFDRYEIREGKPAKIMTGVYMGHTIKVGSVRDGMAEFLIKLFGAEIKTTIPVEHLERVG